MTKIVLFFFLATAASAQDVQLAIQLSPSPSKYIHDWITRKETVQIHSTNTRPTPVTVRIGAQLYRSGVLYASSNPQENQQVTIPSGQKIFALEGVLSPSSLKYSTTAAETMRTGVLPEGQYRLCLTYTLPSTTGKEHSICATTSVTGETQFDILAPRGTINLNMPVMISWIPVIGKDQSIDVRLFQLPQSTTTADVLSNQSPYRTYPALTNGIRLSPGELGPVPTDTNVRFAIVLVDRQTQRQVSPIQTVTAESQAPAVRPSDPCSALEQEVTALRKENADLRGQLSSNDKVSKPQAPAIPRTRDTDTNYTYFFALGARTDIGGKSDEFGRGIGQLPAIRFYGNTIELEAPDGKGGYILKQFQIPDGSLPDSTYFSQHVNRMYHNKPPLPKECRAELRRRCANGVDNVFWGEVFSVTNTTSSQHTVSGRPVKELHGSNTLSIQHGWIYDCKKGKFVRQFSVSYSSNKDGKEEQITSYSEYEEVDPAC